MTQQGAVAVVGRFPDLGRAEGAVAALRRAGYGEAQLTVAVRSPGAGRRGVVVAAAPTDAGQYAAALRLLAAEGPAPGWGVDAA
jgi:hypothetical protein